ncbi:hypothetical protein JTE90_020466 [Oedothorax gibbosus]|uniref:Uncharacterized protein n=1 Tax=Oedothorax gibbosus TaxID=931172 RepID=A0AAV6U8K1_9ARAC|nr:hypothetical protein JTE90_020466 [Oedothorax gibbosus]
MFGGRKLLEGCGHRNRGHNGPAFPFLRVLAGVDGASSEPGLRWSHFEFNFETEKERKIERLNTRSRREKDRTKSKIALANDAIKERVWRFSTSGLYH